MLKFCRKFLFYTLEHKESSPRMKILQIGFIPNLALFGHERFESIPNIFPHDDKLLRSL